MLVTTSAQTRAYSRGSDSIHVFKGHYKSDKPDGVIPREEAEVRHYAMETSISGGIVATIRFSLSIPPTRRLARNLLRLFHAKPHRKTTVSSCPESSTYRLYKATGCFSHTFDGIVSNAFRRVVNTSDRVYSYPHSATPYRVFGHFRPVNLLCLRLSHTYLFFTNSLMFRDEYRFGGNLSWSGIIEPLTGHIDYRTFYTSITTSCLLLRISEMLVLEYANKSCTDCFGETFGNWFG